MSFIHSIVGYFWSEETLPVLFTDLAPLKRIS
jgi:hypothetical protein